MTARSHVVEEPPKPDKRRILIKRKKEDEPPSAVSSAPITEDERSAQPIPPVTVPHRPRPWSIPLTVALSITVFQRKQVQARALHQHRRRCAAKQEEMPAKPTVVAPTIAGSDSRAGDGQKEEHGIRGH